MAYVRQIPGGDALVETGARVAQIPGSTAAVETVVAASTAIYSRGRLVNASLSSCGGAAKSRARIVNAGSV